MTPDEIRSLTLIEVAEAIRTRKLTSTEVTQACIDHAIATEPTLHTFVYFMPKEALVRAAEADVATARGESWGPLHGVPVAFKDNLDTAGIPTECGSPVLKGRIPAIDGDRGGHRLRDARDGCRRRGAHAGLALRTRRPEADARPREPRGRRLQHVVG